MKKFMFLFVLFLLVGFFAAGCKGKGKAEKSDVAGAEKKAEEQAENLLLSEKEVTAFIDAYPVFVEITKNKEKEIEPLKDTENLLSGMRFAKEFEEYAEEIEAALGKYGFTLESFGATYGKIMGAVVYSQMGETHEGVKKLLDDPNVPEEQKEEIRKSLKEYEESEEMKACKENWKIVEKYRSEIERLFKDQ
jgi:ABC-type glycerol-3-phosphate transport system substrate-binding protein